MTYSSLMCSRVSDAGPGMAKEFCNRSLEETIPSGKLMDGIVGIIGLLILEAVFR